MRVHLLEFALAAALLTAYGAQAQPRPYGHWVTAEEMKIYVEPKVDATVLTTFSWASQVEIDKKRASHAPFGWFPISVYLKDQSGKLRRNEKDGTRLFPGWMQQSDLWDGVLKKVIGCWPVKHIIYTMGDYEVEIQFKTDGSGIVLEKSDDSSHGKGQLRTHAYMTKDIVQFNATNQDRRYLFTAGYKPSDRRLYPNGVLDYAQQTLFSDRELKGCASSPTTR